MNPDQQPMPAARAALESLYYDEATELCDLCPLAEQGDDRLHNMHLAIVEALADAHEAGMRDSRERALPGPGAAREAWKRLVAAAIANARGMRRGAPPIVNVLDILPPKMLAEVMDDAEGVLVALECR